MSIPFSRAKDPKIGLLDKLTFGKLKDCRVCDVIPDHFEYLLWLKSQGIVQFQKEVLDTIEDVVNNKGWEVVEEEPEKIKDAYENMMQIYKDWEDDVPF